MGAALILIGVGCMIAAIVGGGVKLQQLEVGTVKSLRRQTMLGLFGALLSTIGLALNLGYFDTPIGGPAAAPANVAEPGANLAPLAANVAAAETNAAQALANVAAPPSKPAPDNAPPPVIAPVNQEPKPPPVIVPANQGPKPPPPQHSKPQPGPAQAQPQAAVPIAAAPAPPPSAPAPVLDIQGQWVDDLGRSWSFQQQGANLVAIGGNPGNRWLGRGSLNGDRLSFSITEEALKITSLCRGTATDGTKLVFTCAAPGMTPLKSVLRRP